MPLHNLVVASCQVFLMIVHHHSTTQYKSVDIQTHTHTHARQTSQQFHRQTTNEIGHRHVKYFSRVGNQYAECEKHDVLVLTQSYC